MEDYIRFIPSVALVLAITWTFWRSNALLYRWAERNHYRIVRKRFRWFRRGPFFWTSSNVQTVYYVTVEDTMGRPRTGWVRCGGWYLGLWSDKAEVQWED